MSIGKGVPPPAYFGNIIQDLFRNEKVHNDEDGVHNLITFARASLTDTQKSNLSYPTGFTPIDFFIIYQSDTYAEQRLISSSLQLISFGYIGTNGRPDPFIYGYYYDITGMDRFRIPDLETSFEPITISDNVDITETRYLEMYNCVNGTTVILSLSTLNAPKASLQYSHGDRYFYEELNPNGIINSKIPLTTLTGLSNSLTNLV